MDILMRILFGLLGILLYAFLSAKDKDDVSVTSVRDYFSEFYIKWVIVLGIICIIATVIQFAPEAGSALEAMSGVEVTTNLISFFWIGYNLSSVSRKIGNM